MKSPGKTPRSKASIASLQNVANKIKSGQHLNVTVIADPAHFRVIIINDMAIVILFDDHETVHPYGYKVYATANKKRAVVYETTTVLTWIKDMINRLVRPDNHQIMEET